jgi:16S rRNA (guanine527-N7)-methyltransferase
VEHDGGLSGLIETAASSINLSLSTAHIERFLTYIHELLIWNEKVNLTGIDRPIDVVIKHFIDSLAALTFCNIPLESVVIDVGSGAGFPGIPLKIVRADLQVLLVEPVRKKSSFLTSLIGHLKLEGISVFDGTIERYVAIPGARLADFVAVRALKFETICHCICQVLKPNGRVLLYRAQPLGKLLPPNFQLTQETHFSLPQGYGQRVLSVIEMATTDSNVPRGTLPETQL